jgi:hypothetical protein
VGLGAIAPFVELFTLLSFAESSCPLDAHEAAGEAGFLTFIPAFDHVELRSEVLSFVMARGWAGSLPIVSCDVRANALAVLWEPKLVDDSVAEVRGGHQFRN